MPDGYDEMREFVNEFEVRNFIKYRRLNGKCVEGTYRGISLHQQLSAKIYPNGDKLENKDYVSIAFSRFKLVPKRSLAPEISSLNCTVSVVDINGESRFPQSFERNLEKRLEHYPMTDTRKRRRYKSLPDRDEKAIRRRIPSKLERFISRKFLLDSREELLPDGTLTLRCDITCFYKYIQSIKGADSEMQRFNTIAEEESWFIQPTNGNYTLLDLRNPDTPLCTRLREKSEFFEALFRWPGKEMEDGHMCVPESEYSSFIDMLCYIRFESLHHIRSKRQYCQMYEMAAKYGVQQLLEQCSSYLVQHMKTDWAIDALKIADMNNDTELREAAFRCILSNWTRVRVVNSYWFDRLNRDLKNQLTCAAHILNVKEEPCDRLCCLAARVVQLNRQRVLNSPIWPIFARVLPNLARVVASMEYTLNDSHSDQSEDYKQQPFHYDSYR